MLDELLASRETLPPFTPGTEALVFPNFRVVTDYSLTPERDLPTENFFIEPLTSKGVNLLISAATAHNIYTFEHRPIENVRARGINIIPCLRVEYFPRSLPSLFRGIVETPLPGHSTIPSPQRMEQCVTTDKRTYTFFDNQKIDIPNINTRDLRMLQAIYKDEVPTQIMSSDGPDMFYKVRNNWWTCVCLVLELGVHENEFTNLSIKQQIQEFLKKYLGSEFRNRLTTGEDIASANRLINTIWQAYGESEQLQTT